MENYTINDLRAYVAGHDDARFAAVTGGVPQAHTPTTPYRFLTPGDHYKHGWGRYFRGAIDAG